MSRTLQRLNELRPLIEDICTKYAVKNPSDLYDNPVLLYRESQLLKEYQELEFYASQVQPKVDPIKLPPVAPKSFKTTVSEPILDITPVGPAKKVAPEITSPLRSSIIEMPSVIRNASGIVVYGKRIKSIVYSLDVSLIANTDADAILCVYPFTPNTQILNAVSLVAKAPIFVGVGGGLTQGERSARLASHAEENNASGIVLNGPVSVETTKLVRDYVDIPVIYTVIDKTRSLQEYVDAGVNIFNVSGGKDTIELVKWVREQFPDFPIIASGGKTDESIQATIDAGANAITYTAYGMMEEYFHKKMETYRH